LVRSQQSFESRRAAKAASRRHRDVLFLQDNGSVKVSNERLRYATRLMNTTLKRIPKKLKKQKSVFELLPVQSGLVA